MSDLYIIQYDIKEDQKVVERIKALGSWMKYFPQSMIVQTSLSPKEIYDRLSVDYESERFLIFKLEKRYYGRLPTDAWDWLKEK